jgi:hypothetical protein
MRKFALWAFLFTAFFIWLNRNDSSKPTASNPAPAAQTKARQISEHDWAKRSLDRARTVRDQARENQIESQQP